MFFLKLTEFLVQYYRVASKMDYDYGLRWVFFFFFSESFQWLLKKIFLKIMPSSMTKLSQVLWYRGCSSASPPSSRIFSVVPCP